MTLFNNRVLEVLAKHQVIPTAEQQAQYISACDEVKENGIMGHKSRKKDLGSDYSIFHAPASEPGRRYAHLLVLPTKPNWITKEGEKRKDDEKRLFVNKPCIDLETGEEWVLKITRPKNPRSRAHMVPVYQEQTNNMNMGEKVEVFTRYDFEKGLKGYLLQPYRGNRNLLDLIKDSKVDSKLLKTVLIEAGQKLKAIHEQGKLHLDFKLENIAIHEKDNHISVIDYETLISQEQGNEGVHQLKGTTWYMNKEWMKVNFQKRLKKEPIRYDTSNDVFAYLKMAEVMLSEAIAREPNQTEKQTLQKLFSQIETWKSIPMKALPTLGEVLTWLESGKLVQESYIKTFLKAFK